MLRRLTACLVLASLAACGADSSEPTAPRTTPPAGADASDDVADDRADEGDGGEAAVGSPDTVTAMIRRADELRDTPEHGAERVRVRHVLIGFRKSPGLRGVSRRRGDAERLAAEVLEEALAGADFAELVLRHSDDDGPGDYTMTADAAAAAGDRAIFARADMQPAFGDVAWRLGVGEIGVCLHDESRSPYGWHVIERLE